MFFMFSSVKKIIFTRHFFAPIFSVLLFSACGNSLNVNATRAENSVNYPIEYPVTWSEKSISVVVDPENVLSNINRRIFGTNLEWFNNGGGLAPYGNPLGKKVIELVKQQQTSVMRYPGGTLADFYNWRDGIGPVNERQPTKHPTDPGTSLNNFGTPEFFQFLKDTGSEGLITVNAGTGTAEEAADWVAYANNDYHPLRVRDGFKEPMNIKLWEIGNEIYLPGNPGELKITVTPEEYVKRYRAFNAAMKAVDPSITTVAIGIARADLGPKYEREDWTHVLLKEAASEIDMLAVHNAYFPVLYTERQPAVASVYPSLLASPEAVSRSLDELVNLMEKYEPADHDITIAITEWGALFSLPDIDNHWMDHVKTIGSGVYIARLMQVFMANPRVEMANYFKLVDRSFMGWISYDGIPKVPFWVISLYSNYSGNERIFSEVRNSPTYDSPAIGGIMAEKDVPEVTVIATRDLEAGKMFINFVNRSMTTGYPIDVTYLGEQFDFNRVMLYRIQANEITSHNGVDIPPEWPYGKAYEPYTTAATNSIKIEESSFDSSQPLKLAPFSMATLVVDIARKKIN
jgi:alpha-N-arabinofuranosidase